MAYTGYEKEERREGPWSDLPIELVELILEKCNFSDQARLRAVRWRWPSIPRVQPIKQLPWLMACDVRKWSRCKLFDLTYNRTYTVNISTMKEYCKDKNPSQIWICASKSGWLLLCHFVPQSLTTAAFFLYSPFTNRMLKLPNLKTSSHRGVSATFSADPTSADCVFFALQHSSHAISMEASTCRLGDTTWTTHVFPGYFPAINCVVYSEGLFWCASPCGILATFSVAQGIWNVRQSPAPLSPSNYVQKRPYMVEFNGNLLLVLISHKDKMRSVFKLDRSQMAWISVEDVGDQTLFLDPTSLSVSVLPTKLGVSGKIHYSRDYNDKFLPKNRLRPYTNPKGYRSHTIKIWIEAPNL